MTRRFWFITALIMTLLITAIPTTAQDQRTLDRIDQAMAHLTTWLGRDDAPITRSTHSWQWQEVIYGDASFACGLPGVEYPATPDRAFQVTITVDGTAYDYRVSGDGTILVLCGADGVPLFRSDTPVDQEEDEAESLPNVDWFAMVYSDGTDLIRLFNADGLQATIKRPELPNEAVPSDVQLAISPNGRYLVQNVLLANDSYAIGIYDIRDGVQRTIAAGIGETASMGFGTSLIFSPDSDEVAVSFATLDQNNNQWRVAVIDLATGTITREINAAGLAPILISGDSELTNAINGTSGIFFPQVAYMDDNGGIHARMILWFAGGALSYPAFVWFPEDNVANISPYGRVGIDILRGSGDALYTFNDPNLPALEAEVMFPPENTLARGVPANTVLQQQVLFSRANSSLGRARWAAGGDYALFRITDNVLSSQWAMIDTGGTGIPFTLLPANYTDVISIADGFLALTEIGEGGADIILHTDNIPGPTVFTAPPQNGDTRLLWALPANTTFGIDSISVGDLVSLPPESVYLGSGLTIPDAGEPAAPVVDGPVLCDGTPSSRITVGERARVTVTDGAPLNVRTGPGTGNAIVDVLAEGTEFNVVGGPECANGFTWWRLELPGAVFAWAAEGDSDDYFIEPLP